MNIENIQLRLKEIEKALENEKNLIIQHTTNVNILEGGKLECLYWLNMLKNELLTEEN